MMIALFAYSRQGCETARRIMDCLPDDCRAAYTVERLAEAPFQAIPKPSQSFYGDLFKASDALIFVGSCGIAVRMIAPHVKDKKTDPAVICVDELGHFVIPILSGHIGGANELAEQLARLLSATAVITTATDINHRFSVDTWARQNDFIIDDMALAKAVSAAVLEGSVPFETDFSILSPLPNGLTTEKTGSLGIYLGYKVCEPFEKTLRLIPKSLHLGIGCRKGIAASSIAEAVEKTLCENGLNRRAIKCAASIDLKKDEAGLHEFCTQNDWPVDFYPAEELAKLEGDFTPSAFVKSVTGVDNVCERAALMGADRLIVKKTALNGVTVAVAAEKTEVRF